MATQIENRLLGLQFDNEQFERGAAQSIQTLGKLKDALALKGADTGASNLQKAFSNLSFNAVTNGLNNVTQSFSVLEQIGIGALRSLGSQIENLGVKLVKNLGLNQFTAGWGKYNAITQSVQTIIAATGKSIEEVTKYTDKLNWFTDETSYSLTDMTNNIAKFTSAGIDLDKAVDQMMGIGNAAALAGAGVQGASHAMSGFSKAMAAGYMSTINWSWIQTAKLDTLAFKQALIDAAVEVGTLKKVGDAYYTVAKGTEITAENMREGLSEKWLNTKAMEKALSVYGEFSSKLNELYELTGNGSYYTTSELLEYINQFKEGTLTLDKLTKISNIAGVSVEDLSKQFETLSSSAYDTGRKAFAAAQEAITLSQAWEALADAVSTGWMKTFQLIFGNYEEAKSLWTDLANWLYDLFAESGNVRNELLEEWHFTESGGYKDFINGITNIMSTITSLRDLLRQFFGAVVPTITPEVLVKWTNKFNDATTRLSEKVADIQQKFDDYRNGILLSGPRSLGAVITRTMEVLTGSAEKIYEESLADKLTSEPVPSVTKETRNTSKKASFVDGFSLFEDRGGTYDPRTDDIVYLNQLVKQQNAQNEYGLSYFAQKIGEVYDNIPDISTYTDLIDRKTRGRHPDVDTDSSLKYFSEKVGDLIDSTNTKEEALTTFTELIQDRMSRPSATASVTDGRKDLTGLVRRFSNKNYTNPIMQDLYNVGEYDSSKGEDSPIVNLEKLSRRFDNLDDVLLGLRSTVVIVKNAFELFWSSLKTMFAPAKILGDDFLELFGAIGRRIQDVSLKLVGEGRMVRFFRDLGTSGGSVIEKLVDGIHKFIVALTELIDPSVESSASSFLGTIIELVKTLWSGVGTIIQTFTPMIGSLVNLLKELFTGLGNAIKDFFGDGVKFTDFTNRLKSILDVGILGGIAVLVKKLNDIIKKFKGKGIKEIISELINGDKGDKDGGILNIKGLFGNIKTKFDELGKGLKSFADNISSSLAKFTNSNLLQEFANSILKIAAAMLIIALIPQDKFARATITIAGLIASIVGMFYLFSKMDFKKAANITAIGTAMAGIGTGLLFIAASILVIALIPADKLDQGLKAITVALIELTGLLTVVSMLDAKRMLAAGASILLISAGIDLITIALVALSLIPGNKLLKSVGVLALALTAIVAAIAVLTKLTFFGKRLIAAAASILIVASALDLITVALVALAFVPIEKLAAGVIALSVMLFEIATVLAILGEVNSIGMLAAAAAMLIMAPAILIFAGALAVLAFVPFLALAGGLVVLGAALAGIVVAAYAITPVIPGLLALAAAFVAIGAGTVLLGAGLALISASVAVIVLAVTGGITAIINALATLVASIRGTVADSSAEAGEGGVLVSNSLIDALTSAWSGGIGDAVKNMISGLVDKVKTKASELWSAGVELARSIWNGFKDKLGIRSPSRVMAKEMEHVIAGLGVGLDRNEGSIRDIGYSMAQNLLDASDETFGTYEPSLTPVLDMSQARAGNLSFGATLTPGAARNLASVSADIRDQRDSMNDYIDQAVTSAINGMRDELTFVVPLEVDGRQFAASTARFTRSELNLMDRNAMRKGGLINA